MNVIRLLSYFTLLSLIKHSLAYDGKTSHGSACLGGMTSLNQCSCPISEGVLAILNTSRQVAAPTSLTFAHSSSIDPPRSSAEASIAKRGFAYNDASLVDSFTESVRCTKCSWAYNWDSTDYGLLQPSLDFVPMLWSPAPQHTERWPQNVEAMILSGSTHILGFNECDRPDQCNLNAEAAAAAHVEFVNGYANRHGVKIGSPAISNSAVAGQGLSWLRLWVQVCDSLPVRCKYDFCVAHWYGDSVESLLNYVSSVREICPDKPIWLTEFAVDHGSDEQHAVFITAVVPLLDAIDYLERYAYFMIREGRFVYGPTITPSGQAYAEA
ncbi:hypothetical protein CNYM01_12928 [Colletotrichum nymphaeae SA-01]|uniref:Asl1-like glycosyl hydrolase catalytic domain-containing protein n=1 Tax=Colletotrichum nymphaeae SA-01 TaxID=1460502 RepID=A0A135TRX4_9PEZI|nr:hypothetical protein CNYM01_12928 [Colletotrichum nymphaeae SA-01]